MTDREQYDAILQLRQRVIRAAGHSVKAAPAIQQHFAERLRMFQAIPTVTREYTSARIRSSINQRLEKGKG